LLKQDRRCCQKYRNLLFRTSLLLWNPTLQRLSGTLNPTTNHESLLLHYWLFGKSAQISRGPPSSPDEVLSSITVSINRWSSHEQWLYICLDGRDKTDNVGSTATQLCRILIYVGRVSTLLPVSQHAQDSKGGHVSGGWEEAGKRDFFPARDYLQEPYVGPLRRKIRLIEGNAKCRHLKIINCI
jgi:hypothetical protein